MLNIWPLKIIFLLVLTQDLFAQTSSVCDHGLKPRFTQNLRLNQAQSIVPFEPPRFKSMARSKDEAVVEQKILILSAAPKNKDPALKAAIKFLGHFGIPFEYIELTDENGTLKNINLDLIAEDQIGKYSGVVLTDLNLSYFDKAQNKYLSALSSAQWQSLFNYSVQYSIRTVSLLTYPQVYVGVSAIIEGGTDRADMISLHPEIASKYAPDLNRDALVDLKSNWHYPVNIIDRPKTKGLIKSSHHKDQYLATLHQSDDGREQMHFFFSQHPDSLPSIWASSLWIKWLTHNTHLGMRQSFLNIQVDDFFIPTHLWSPETMSDDGEVYRLDPTDVESFLNFQDFYLRPQTGRNDFRVELAYNGKGLEDYGGLFIDQLGLNLKKNLQHFTWLTHTYHHYELNDVSYETAMEEVSLNREIELSLNKRYQSVFSQSGIVTPRISGLKNPDVLKAFYHAGKKFVVGDNTVEDLRPKKEHLARKTQLNLHGHEGLMIIPRYPNDIFYHVSTPQEIHSLFNHLYFPEQQDEYSFEQILEKNVDEVLARMMSYDASSNMFHQANMRHFSYQGRWTSLMSEWMRGAIEKFRKLSSLPILSLDMDRLSQRYWDRDKFESCQVRMLITKKKGAISKLTISSAQSCTAPITLESAGTFINAPAYYFEQYGPDKIYHLYLSEDEPQVIHL